MCQHIEQICYVNGRIRFANFGNNSQTFTIFGGKFSAYMHTHYIKHTFHAVAVVLVSAMVFTSCTSQNQWRRAQGAAWGTSYHITYYGDRALDDSVVAVMRNVQHLAHQPRRDRYCRQQRAARICASYGDLEVLRR